MSLLDPIQEMEMRAERCREDDHMASPNEPMSKATKENADNGSFSLASLEVLNHVKINVDPVTPVLTLKKVLKTSSKHDSSFSKEKLGMVEQQMRQAFIEFYQELRLLKSYR